MKIHYYSDTDSLYIDLNSKPGVETREIVEGLVVDMDAKGNVVGIDIDQASKKIDMQSLEMTAFPPGMKKVA